MQVGKLNCEICSSVVACLVWLYSTSRVWILGSELKGCWGKKNKKTLSLDWAVINILNLFPSAFGASVHHTVVQF